MLALVDRHTYMAGSHMVFRSRLLRESFRLMSTFDLSLIIYLKTVADRVTILTLTLALFSR